MADLSLTLNYLKAFKRCCLNYRKVPAPIAYTDLFKLVIRHKLGLDKLSVAWFLCGNEMVGSSRIHGINISDCLKHYGVNSSVIQKPTDYLEDLLIDECVKNILLDSGIDIVVFQRVHQEKACKFASSLKKSNTKTVFIMADIYNTEMPFACDHCIVISETLKQHLISNGVSTDCITVIPDAIETPYSLLKDYNGNSSDEVKVVWVGAEGSWESLQIITEALMDNRLSNYRLITISNHPSATYRWDIRSVWAHILEADIAIIPVEVGKPETLVKSNNRLTMFKALGLPVICSHLPAYGNIIVHGQNGYFALTKEEWVNYLMILSSPEVRKTVGLMGRESIFEQYGLQNISMQYLTAFSALLSR